MLSTSSATGYPEIARIKTRRSFLTTTGASAAGALAAPRIAGPAFGKDQPNVLFIAVDDRNDWIGCLGGHPDSRTRNIDRLASRGVNFTRAYCNAPSCNPKKPVLDFRAQFYHSAPMETHAFGFSLRANAPEGQKRFPISPRGTSS